MRHTWRVPARPAVPTLREVLGQFLGDSEPELFGSVVHSFFFLIDFKTHNPQKKTRPLNKGDSKPKHHKIPNVHPANGPKQIWDSNPGNSNENCQEWFLFPLRVGMMR
jgi:hypothetical protein